MTSDYCVGFFVVVVVAVFPHVEVCFSWIMMATY